MKFIYDIRLWFLQIPFLSWVKLLTRTSSNISHCSYYIIAEGFRFLPLSLVRLRTFRLSAWVSWVQPWWRCQRVGANRADMSLRCHNTPRQNGWRVAGDVTHRKRAEVCGDLNKVRESKIRGQTRRIDFWSSQARGELAPYGGGARVGGQMNKT